MKVKALFYFGQIGWRLLIILGLFQFLIPVTGQSMTKLTDLSNGVIVCPAGLKTIEAKAITVLVEEIEKRTALKLPVRHQLPDDQRPVILVGTEKELQKLTPAALEWIRHLKKPGAEGYRAFVRFEKHPVVLLVGNDARGVFYAVGAFLRRMQWAPKQLQQATDWQISTTPRYQIRGHQLGYRPKTNAYDAWDTAQFDQYIRELALFGANCIEIIPPRTDDDRTSPLMKMNPLAMLVKQAEIIDSYGMDVWIWYPNMGTDYSHPDSIQKELKERDVIFKKLKRIDVVFVPGGDPGDLHPNILFAWLEKLAVVLQKYHPRARIWISPQAFRPVPSWLEAFYQHVNQKYPWFGGVVFGPWVKTPLPEMRQIVDRAIPIRRYPDITHSLSCQYPVKDWDLAFAMTLGRECYNPRPVAEKAIHNALDKFANGSLSYSEGINDDVNKFIWSAQDWDPNTPVIKTLREYSRLFISVDHADEIAHGILDLERNWVGRLLTNQQVDVTLQQWQTMEKRFPGEVIQNYRFRMGLLRAYYDEYIKARLVYETDLERKVWNILRNAPHTGSEIACQSAETVLSQAWEAPVAQDYQTRCWEIADHLFKQIGSQTSVKKHQAMPGRGDFMDFIDVPLNDAVWLLSQIKKIRQMPDENTKLSAIDALLNWTNPGPGGFYHNLGPVDEAINLTHYPSWNEDPGSLQSPRTSFGVGLRGEEWVHTVEAKGFDGSATPLTWMNQITTLYDTPLTMIFDELDPQAGYTLKIAYTGRFRSRIKLMADGQYLIHDFIQTGTTPLHEFEIPKAATADGILELTWTCGEGQRGAQVAEIWLMRKSE